MQARRDIRDRGTQARARARALALRPESQLTPEEKAFLEKARALGVQLGRTFR